MSDQSEVAIARGIAMAARSGAETSEFRSAKSSGLWGIIAMALGAVISVAPAIMSALGSALGESSPWVVAAGAVIAVAGIIQKALVDVGFIAARRETKAAVARAVESLGE